MLQRLDYSRSPRVSTRLSEKVRPEIVDTWRTLGFIQDFFFPRRDTLTMDGL